MTQGILTLDQLDSVVDDYLQFEEYVIDVETMGAHRDDPQRNDIFWVTLAGPGRVDIIPCGHPVGEKIPWPTDETHRMKPHSKVICQERRINPASNKMKWFDTPQPFTPAPKQLWISDVTEHLKRLFFYKPRRRRIVGQNVKFDLESLAKYFGAVPPPPYGDTLVAAKLIDETYDRYDLESIVEREFDYVYANLGRTGVEKFPYSQAFHYNHCDGRFTWLYWELCKQDLRAEKMRHLFDLEMQLLPALIDMEMAGVLIDEKALDLLNDDYAKQMAAISIEIDERASRLAGREVKVELSKRRQLAWLVYDLIGKPCTAYTPEGIKALERGDKERAKLFRSTSRADLEAFSKNPIVKLVLEHGRLFKLWSAFVVSIKAKLNEGKIHPSFNQVGTVSGRLSCKNPNVQQMPSRSEEGKKIRDLFIASPGKIFVVADLSQIELRMLAHFTQDPALLRAYRQGLDLHAITAERAFGTDFTPLERSLAKNANFSVLYGAGPLTMVRKYSIPNLKTAEILLEAFYGTYRFVKPWKKDVLEEARRRYRKGVCPPYVVTLLGRRRHLPRLLWLDNKLRSAAERQAISVTISGSSADLFKVIMIRCQAQLDRAGWKGHMLMTVHDELIVEVPEENAEEAAELVREAMEHVLNPFTGRPIISVPLVADVKIVPVWGQAKA
jgi:DNA polymerase I-like protein with 3'-5' exonuclease and polymerase domains